MSPRFLLLGIDRRKRLCVTFRNHQCKFKIYSLLINKSVHRSSLRCKLVNEEPISAQHHFDLFAIISYYYSMNQLYYPIDFEAQYQEISQQIVQLTQKYPIKLIPTSPQQEIQDRLATVLENVEQNELLFQKENIYSQYATAHELSEKFKNPPQLCPNCGEQMKKIFQCELCAEVFCKSCCWRKRVIPFVGKNPKLCCEVCHFKFVKLFHNKDFYEEKERLVSVINFVRTRAEKIETKKVQKLEAVEDYKKVRAAQKQKQKNIELLIEEEKKKYQLLQEEFQRVIAEKAHKIMEEERRKMQEAIEQEKRKKEEEKQNAEKNAKQAEELRIKEKQLKEAKKKQERNQREQQEKARQLEQQKARQLEQEKAKEFQLKEAEKKKNESKQAKASQGSKGSKGSKGSNFSKSSQEDKFQEALISQKPSKKDQKLVVKEEKAKQNQFMSPRLSSIRAPSSSNEQSKKESENNQIEEGEGDSPSLEHLLKMQEKEVVPLLFSPAQKNGSSDDGKSVRSSMSYASKSALEMTPNELLGAKIPLVPVRASRNPYQKELPVEPEALPVNKVIAPEENAKARTNFYKSVVEQPMGSTEELQVSKASILRRSSMMSSGKVSENETAGERKNCECVII